MQLLIYSQYFWPESFIINDLAKLLRDQGHTVVVATGKPNYPEGKIFPGYQAAGVQKEIYDSNIEVFRVPLRPRGKGGARGLLLNYLSFVFSGARYFPSLLKDRSFDAILVFAGSPNVALSAIPLKYMKKAHLALWIQDLWPESLSATGYIRNRLILRIVGWVVRMTYWTADTILVQSPAFKAPVSRYAREDKIIYYPNSMHVQEEGSFESSTLPEELLETLKRRFCVVFAGNIGTAQSVQTLVDAALHLKDLPEVRLVLVGSGSMSEWVHQKVKALGLDNVVLAGRFPVSAMPAIYRHAAGLLVTLKNEEIFAYTIPSKVQSYLAAGKPVIGALNGEGARVIEEAGAGLTCAAEDSLGLANCVRSLYQMPEKARAQMGAAGKRYFMEHFEMRRQASQLLEILEQRMAKKPVN